MTKQHDLRTLLIDGARANGLSIGEVAHVAQTFDTLQSRTNYTPDVEQDAQRFKGMRLVFIEQDEAKQEAMLLAFDTGLSLLNAPPTQDKFNEFFDSFLARCAVIQAQPMTCKGRGPCQYNGSNTHSTECIADHDAQCES